MRHPNDDHPIITLVTMPDEAFAELPGALIEQINRAWPSGPAPRWQRCTTAEVLSRADSTPAVVLPADAVDALSLIASAQAADPEHARPVLCLHPAGRFVRPFSNHSVVWLPVDAPPSAIAGSLHVMVAWAQTQHEQGLAARTDARIRAAAARQIDAHQAELQLASLVQRELLPREFPTVPGLQFGVLYRPGAALSGDFFDVQRLDERHAGFFLADATGHGVPAALLMMLVSRLLVAKEAARNSYRLITPAEAMTRLNAAFMHRRGELTSLVSAAYGVIDGHSGEVSLASAGHPPGLIVGGAGRRRWCEGGGPPLGAVDDFQYGELTFRLDPGESLLLYSDGFEHLFRSDASSEPTSPHRAPCLLAETCMSALDSLGVAAELPDAISALQKQIDHDPGSLHQADDISLLAVRRAA